MIDEIQRELADRGKQQIVPIYHDMTRYVTFEPYKESVHGGLAVQDACAQEV